MRKEQSRMSAETSVVAKAKNKSFNLEVTSQMSSKRVANASLHFGFRCLRFGKTSQMSCVHTLVGFYQNSQRYQRSSTYHFSREIVQSMREGQKWLANDKQKAKDNQNVGSIIKVPGNITARQSSPSPLRVLGHRTRLWRGLIIQQQNQPRLVSQRKRKWWITTGAKLSATSIRINNASGGWAGDNTKSNAFFVQSTKRVKQYTTSFVFVSRFPFCSSRLPLHLLRSNKI